jgi:hypothetical protein
LHLTHFCWWNTVEDKKRTMIIITTTFNQKLRKTRWASFSFHFNFLPFLIYSWLLLDVIFDSITELSEVNFGKSRIDISIF